MGDWWPFNAVTYPNKHSDLEKAPLQSEAWLQETWVIERADHTKSSLFEGNRCMHKCSSTSSTLHSSPYLQDQGFSRFLFAWDFFTSRNEQANISSYRQNQPDSSLRWGLCEKLSLSSKRSSLGNEPALCEALGRCGALGTFPPLLLQTFSRVFL
jgi:hypothetical protein